MQETKLIENEMNHSFFAKHYSLIIFVANAAAQPPHAPKAPTLPAHLVPFAFCPFVLRSRYRLHNTIGVEVERAHLLLNTIENLERDDGFYSKCTIQFAVYENDALLNAFKAAEE